MRTHLILNSVLLLCIACSGGSSSDVSGELEAECQAFCSLPESCSAQDADDCLVRCRGSVSEVAEACALCMLANPTDVLACAPFVDPAAIGGANPACQDVCSTAAHPGNGGDFVFHCRAHCTSLGTLCTPEDSVACLEDCTAAVSGRDFTCGFCSIHSLVPLDGSGVISTGCNETDVREADDPVCSAYCE